MQGTRIARPSTESDLFSNMRFRARSHPWHYQQCSQLCGQQPARSLRLHDVEAQGGGVQDLALELAALYHWLLQKLFSALMLLYQPAGCECDTKHHFQY